MTVVRDTIPGRKLTNYILERFARATIEQALRDFIEGRTDEEDLDPRVFLGSGWCKDLCGLCGIDPELIHTVLTQDNLISPGRSRGVRWLELTNGNSSQVVSSLKAASETLHLSVTTVARLLRTKDTYDGWTIKELFGGKPMDMKHMTRLTTSKVGIEAAP